MSAVIVALALSLFGVFTINVSIGGLGAGTGGEGLAGSFFNGVLATVLATPCTAPFLGTALGFAFAQPAAAVVGLFLAIGAGMAAPYAVLAARPGWLRLLPRPGAWMGRFEQGMGFLMLGTVVWLLWVLGKQVGADGVVWTCAFLLVVAVAVWIPGQWADLRSSRRRRVLAWAVAGLLVAAGTQLLVLPLLRADRALAAAGLPDKDELPWEPFSQARVEQLLRAGRQPVLLVFTAEWCWTCKVNERTVLADAAVQARMRALDLAVVRADWTSRNPQITSLLAAFGRSGRPPVRALPRRRSRGAVGLARAAHHRHHAEVSRPGRWPGGRRRPALSGAVTTWR